MLVIGEILELTMPAQAFGVLLLLMVAFADLSMSNPTVDYDHDNVIDIGDDDGPPECTTNISKVSFSCCFHNVDIRGNYSECYNSDEGNEGCHAGNDWTVNEDSCKDVDLTSKLETPDIGNNAMLLKFNLHNGCVLTLTFD